MNVNQSVDSAEAAGSYNLDMSQDFPHSHSAASGLPSIEETLQHTPTEDRAPAILHRAETVNVSSVQWWLMLSNSFCCVGGKLL